ncbi:MAG TPA: hypothetical protein EYP46_01650 [Hadesarchaea archaeon]|nr:hypothetical protein [Hadesarchaea archaeon]
MTRKTGKLAVRAKQQMRAAKAAKYRRELSLAGVSLRLPKPSAKARKEKEEELRKLYLEMFQGRAEQKQFMEPVEQKLEQPRKQKKEKQPGEEEKQ